MINDDKVYLILAVVNEVSKGKVASYKRVAQLAGYPKNARLVGKVMANASIYGNYPCHRIVHSDGSLVAGWQEQRILLENEGIEFIGEKVNLKKYSI